MSYNPYNAAVVFDGGDAPAVPTRRLTSSHRPGLGQLVAGVFTRAGTSESLKRDDKRISEEIADHGWETLIAHRAELSIPWYQSDGLQTLEGEGGSERWMILFYHPNIQTTSISSLRDPVTRIGEDVAVSDVAFRGTPVSSKRELRWMLEPLSKAVAAEDAHRSHLEAHKLFWSVAVDTYAASNHQFWALCPNSSIEEACLYVEHVLGSRDWADSGDLKLDRALAWLGIIGAQEKAPHAPAARMAARLLEADPALAGHGLQNAVQALLD